MKVDELVEDFAGDFEPLIPLIFRFFEKNPLEDCGAPGNDYHKTKNNWVTDINRLDAYTTTNAR